jgi:hypothetical protein
MSVFTLFAIPSGFAGIGCLMHAIGSKKKVYLYAGYLLSMASILCAQAGML